jgi:hypothetical protein
MARQEKLVRDDETTGQIDKEGGQTSNKTGLHSSARKPSNSGPDSHSEHNAPVAGAFGNDDRRDEDEHGGYLNDQAPADKARKRK